MTIAVGSLMASIAVAQVSFIKGLTALAVLYLIQVVIAFLRRFHIVSNIVDNQPVMLFRNGEFLPENMKRSRVTRNDILSKLRESNVHDIGNVSAVVLETTGDISVLHGDVELDSVILEGVKQ